MRNCLISAILAFTVFFTSGCSSDDSADSINESSYLKVRSQLISPDGKEIIPAIEGSDIRFLGCPTKEDARGLVSSLTLSKWDGISPVTLDMGNFGKVSARRLGDDDSDYFALVKIELKDISPFTLSLTSCDYLKRILPDKNGDESGSTKPIPVYMCEACYARTLVKTDVCQQCGGRLLEIPQLSIIPIPSLNIDNVEIDFGMIVQ